MLGLNKYRLEVLTLSLIIIILPMDAAIATFFLDISIINYFIGFYILIRFVKVLLKSGRFYNGHIKAHMLYFVFLFASMIWGITKFEMSNWYIFSMVMAFLFFFFAATDRYEPEEFSLLKKAITLSAIALVIMAIISIDFSSSGRFTLSFGRNMDPNYFSTGLVLIVALCVDNIIKKHHILLNLMLLTSIFYLILRSGSRGGFVASLFVLIVYVFYNKKNVKIYFQMLILITLTITAIYLLKDSIPDWIIERFNFKKMFDSDGSGRTIIWRNALETYFSGGMLSMLFGNGYATFAYANLQRLGKYAYAHNIYLQTLLDLGFVGLVLFAYMILRTLYSAIKEKRVFIVAALSGALVGGFFVDINVSRFFWLIIFMSLMIINNKTKETVYDTNFRY